MYESASTYRGSTPHKRRHSETRCSSGEVLSVTRTSVAVDDLPDRIAARQVGRVLQQSLANVRAMVEP